VSQYLLGAGISVIGHVCPIALLCSHYGEMAQDGQRTAGRGRGRGRDDSSDEDGVDYR